MTGKKPWRTLVIDENEVVGRFTRKQIEEAVLKVKEERKRKAAAKAARVRKTSDQNVPSNQVRQVKTPAKQSDRTPDAARRMTSEGGRRASKKPWRTLAFGSETGRFTREQIDAAVLAVMAESERKAARARMTSGGVASRKGGASKPAKAPARQLRKTSKAA